MATSCCSFLFTASRWSQVLFLPYSFQVKAVAEEMGIGFLGIGFQPKWGLKDIPVMPKVLMGS